MITKRKDLHSKKGAGPFLFVKKEWRILYSAQFALSLQIESLRKLNKNL